MPSGNAPKRLALPRSSKKALKGAKVLGAVKPDERIEVTVRVRRRAATPDAEQARAAGKPLSRDQFRDLFGADPAEVAQIEDFAHRHGLTVLEADLSERKVRLGGPAAAMKAAFGATLNYYSIGKTKFRGRTGAVTVPEDVHPLIEGVFGLDNRPAVRPHFRFRSPSKPSGKQAAGKAKAMKPRAAGGDGSFTPPQVAQLYQFPAGLNGAGQTIGILELGGGYAASDLQTYFSGLNITAPQVVAVSVDGGQNAPTGDPNSADGEVLLDIEVAGAVAPGARLAVYFAPNTDAGFLDMLTSAIHDTIHAPGVISISWGSAESNWTAQALQDFDSHCNDAALLGITVCVASGDNGYTDSTDPNETAASVDFPASSPNVLACGGTFLQGSGSTIANESVWNDLQQGGGATGGGISAVFPVPSFQQSVTLPQPVNAGAGPGRGVPDIAGDADPRSGYLIQVDGQQGVIGGTSAVAPLWAGLIALLNQGLGKSVGFLTPRLYQLPAGASAFNDVTSGDNGGYQAAQGWDACTGLGSPNGTALLEALKTA